MSTVKNKLIIYQNFLLYKEPKILDTGNNHRTLATRHEIIIIHGKKAHYTNKIPVTASVSAAVPAPQQYMLGAM